MALNEFQSAINARKTAIGFDDSAAAVESRRNKGVMRTSGKRELLRRAKARANVAGVTPTVSY